MSLNLASLYGQQYATAVELLLQQQGSKLAGAVDVGTYKGEQASPVDQVGVIEAQDVTTRFAPMGRVDAAVDRRWVFPSDFDLPQLVDSFDKLRLFSDPQSKYVLNATYAMGRKKDRVILNAFFGTAKTGKNGTTSTSFTAGNEIDVAVGGANSRLNVAKLIALKELMQSQFVDFDAEPVYVGIPAKDHSALLNEIQIISSDFNGGDRPVLKDGKVDSFLGFQFIQCELIETVLAGTNEVTLPAWTKSGMHLGMWNELTTDISQRKDLQGLPWQAYLYMTCGATRLQENKVYAIESYRS